jgi:hypothetical protein
VEFAGDKSFYQVDPTWIPPEWHLWMHSTTDSIPTQTTVGDTSKYKPAKLAEGVHTPYERNLGGVIAKPGPNMTQYRPRAFDQSNNVFDDHKVNESLYYTQPGNPLDPRNPNRGMPSRSARLGFSLRDTPVTIRKKEANRAGVSVEKYQAYTDGLSPTRTLIVASKGSPSVLQSAIDAKDELVGEALAHGGQELLPTTQVEWKRALLMSTKTGHARPWGADVELGTLAAEVRSALSKEESDFLDTNGVDEEPLIANLVKYKSFVDSYKHINTLDAKRGVEKATSELQKDTALLENMRAIKAKLEAVTQKFDEKVYQ